MRSFGRGRQAVATACLAQLLTGVLLDARYDPTVRRALWIAPLYPLGCWLLMSLVTVTSTVPALLQRQPDLARWATTREPARLASLSIPQQRPAGERATGRSTA